MNKEKLTKVFKGALIAGSGPAILYLLEALNALDFGELDMVVAALISVLVNFIRQAIRPLP